MLSEHWTASVHHDGSPRYVIGKPDRLGAKVTLRLRIGKDAPVESVAVRTCPDGEQHFRELHLAGSDEDEVCRVWEAELPIEMPRTTYRFALFTGEGLFWYSAAGVTRHTPTDANDFKLLARFKAPAWVHEAVFYQIFPDRFADGDPASNVRTGEYADFRGRPVVARAWGERPGADPPLNGLEFYGGDLPGIVGRLPYLEELGVNALYLTPIFTAPSNHKYDVANYFEVDPHFGGEAALADLRRALDARGMRLILDITPNHCGVANAWFTAAQRDAAAPTAEYFTFHEHPGAYACWLGVQSLPKLDYRSERLRQHMYGGEGAVLRHWLRPPYRIDGWRLDVANMMGRQGEAQLGHKIGRALRRAIKQENPEAYLVGENFFDGSPHLQGEELDATMNYQGFTFPILRWLTGSDAMYYGERAKWLKPHPMPAEALEAQLRAFMAAIPWQIAVQQLNLLGSHDTPRVMTLAGEDEKAARVAATLLFTYPGTPSVYYGDEIGLPGGRDPDNRRCMPWDPAAWNGALRDHYRALIRLRRALPALRYGGYQALHAAGDTFAFQREVEEGRVIVVARRAADGLTALPVRHGGIRDGARFREALTGATARVEEGMLPLLGLGPVDAQIWQTAG